MLEAENDIGPPKSSGVKNTISEKYGINLEEEIIIIKNSDK